MKTSDKVIFIGMMVLLAIATFGFLWLIGLSFEQDVAQSATLRAYEAELASRKYFFVQYAWAPAGDGMYAYMGYAESLPDFRPEDASELNLNPEASFEELGILARTSGGQHGLPMVDFTLEVNYYDLHNPNEVGAYFRTAGNGSTGVKELEFPQRVFRIENRLGDTVCRPYTKTWVKPLSDGTSEGGASFLCYRLKYVLPPTNGG